MRDALLRFGEALAKIPEVIEATRHIVWQDQVAVEAMQARFDAFGDITECSIKSDQAGLQCRRMIAAMVENERPSVESMKAM